MKQLVLDLDHIERMNLDDFVSDKYSILNKLK